MRWVVETGAKVVVVRGYQVRDRLRRDGLHPIWSGSRRGWMLDRKHLGDVEAHCDHAGIRLRVVTAGEAA